MCKKFEKVDIRTTKKTVGKKTDVFCVVERREYDNCNMCPIYKGMNR